MDGLELTDQNRSVVINQVMSNKPKKMTKTLF